MFCQFEPVCVDALPQRECAQGAVAPELIHLAVPSIGDESTQNNLLFDSDVSDTLSP